MRIAFATCRSYGRGYADDQEAAALAGAEFQVWDDPAVDWDAFDRVVIRSVWDYTSRLDAFLEWCGKIGPERLRNSPDLVSFNADKRYLQELQVPTVPTRFVSPGEPAPPLIDEVVVKPNVSAGARDTGRFPPDHHDDALDLIASICDSGRVALVQPYLPLADEQGETAVVHLAGELSHVLRKRPVLRSAGIAPMGEGRTRRHPSCGTPTSSPPPRRPTPSFGSRPPCSPRSVICSVCRCTLASTWFPDWRVSRC
jgi:hypothetical protein